MNIRTWISAFRLRTLPLALSCILMGAFLAGSQDVFRLDIFLLSLLTTVFLQILSNLANDYGDSQHGADHSGRVGPARAVQSGVITSEQMRRAVIIFIALCLVSGVMLLYTSFGTNWRNILAFLGLGIVAIGAAVTYTMGRRPYGYAGLGDLSVLIFFGLVGVLGSRFLYHNALAWQEVLPALSCGFFSIGVLNINNLRDIDSDRRAGKLSIPVRLGRRGGLIYHAIIVGSGIACAVLYVLIEWHSPWQWLFLITIPLFIYNIVKVRQLPATQLDPFLRQMAISTLLFVMCFGAGLLLSR